MQSSLNAGVIHQTHWIWLPDTNGVITSYHEQTAATFANTARKKKKKKDAAPITDTQLWPFECQRLSLRYFHPRNAMLVRY